MSHFSLHQQKGDLSVLFRSKQNSFIVVYVQDNTHFRLTLPVLPSHARQSVSVTEGVEQQLA